MGTTVTVDGTSYTVPAIGELSWGAQVSNLLIALAQKSALATIQKTTVRTIAATTATVFSSDRTVLLTGPSTGATAVSMPTGVNGQIIGIVDSSGNAATYNVTISGNGGQTINGAATLVLSHNNEAVELQFDSSSSDWKVISHQRTNGDITNADISVSAAIAWSKISKSGSNLTDIATRSHTSLSDIGTNTHAQVDSHIASTSNPHSVTKSQVGLGNVTDNAQVKKISSSVNGNLMSWSGTTGDTPADSGYAPSSFATAAHTHAGVYEPANANIQSTVTTVSNYLDQAVKQASSPTFSDLTLTGGDLSFTGDGTAGANKIARTVAGTLNINNGGIIVSGTAITLAQATTIGPASASDIEHTVAGTGNARRTFKWQPTSTNSTAGTVGTVAGGDRLVTYSSTTVLEAKYGTGNFTNIAAHSFYCGGTGTLTSDYAFGVYGAAAGTSYASLGFCTVAGAWTLGDTTKIGSNNYTGNLIVGATDGVVQATGYVGEYLSDFATSVISGGAGSYSTATDCAVTVTSGIWRFTTACFIAWGSTGGTGSVAGILAIVDGDGTVIASSAIPGTGAGSNDYQTFVIFGTKAYSASKTVRLAIQYTTSGGTPTGPYAWVRPDIGQYAVLDATRIA